MKALIVEDDPGMQALLSRALRHAADGIEMRISTKLSEALEEMKNDPDIVLLDLTLEDATKFETLSHLSTFQKTLCVIITGGDRDTIMKSQPNIATENLLDKNTILAKGIPVFDSLIKAVVERVKPRDISLAMETQKSIDKAKGIP